MFHSTLNSFISVFCLFTEHKPWKSGICLDFRFHQSESSLAALFPDLTFLQCEHQCEECVLSFPLALVTHGANPHGLKGSALWQMDMTRYPSFGKQQYLHVIVDAYSGVIMASPSMGESVPKVMAHLLTCCFFFIRGILHSFKTDNGHIYTSKALLPLP